MAINLIKCVNIKNKFIVFQGIRALSPILDNKMYLSTDKPSVVKQNQIQNFEEKLSLDMKTKVLDRLTHTGQTFAENDYRLVRFVGKQKEINPRFAIDLIAEVPPIACTERWASCDGGGGPLGHPKVFINLDEPGEYGTCGYCGLRFYKEEHKH